MHQRDPDPSREAEDVLDDSWFDRPERALTREAVRAALETGQDALGPRWIGLEDSWFDRPARDRAR